MAAAATVAAQQLSERLLTTVKAPKTSTEFEGYWRSLKGDLASQATYLAVIPAAQLPAIFKSSLTPQILSAILRTTLSMLSGSLPANTSSSTGSISGLDSTAGVDLLNALAKVPRLEMAAMCISSKERVELGVLWRSAVETLKMQAVLDDAGAAQLGKLATMFKLL